VNLSLARVEAFDVVHENSDVVQTLLSACFGLDRLAQLLVFLPGGLILEIKRERGS